MNWLKQALSDFPTQNGTVVTALVLILLTGLVVVVRLAIGQPFPLNYDTWIWALVALSGVTTAGMVGKRLSDVAYKNAGQPQVAVDTANVTVSQTPPATPTPDPDKE